MIEIIISGPPKCGKSILAQLIKDALKSLGDSVIVQDASPRLAVNPNIRLPNVFKGTTIQINVITEGK